MVHKFEFITNKEREVGTGNEKWINISLNIYPQKHVHTFFKVVLWEIKYIKYMRKNLKILIVFMYIAIFLNSC